MWLIPTARRRLRQSMGTRLSAAAAEPVLPGRIALGSHDVAIPQSMIEKAGVLSMHTFDKSTVDPQAESSGQSLRPEMIPFTDLPRTYGPEPSDAGSVERHSRWQLHSFVGARVQNNRLELVVQSPQGSSDPITLSLPVDTLDDLAIETGLVRGNSMPTTTGTNTLLTNQNGPDLSSLLAKLQVTEIQVSRPDSNVAAYAGEALESAETLLLDLSIQKNNTPQIIRREIRRSQLDARTSSTHSTSAPVTAPVEKFWSSTADAVDSTGNLHPVAIRDGECRPSGTDRSLSPRPISPQRLPVRLWTGRPRT